MHDDAISKNFQQVPPPTEIDCITTNKVFDSHLIRQCVYPIEVEGVEIAADIIEDVTCSNFTMTVDSPIVPTRRNGDPPGYVRVSFTFTATFTLTVTGSDGTTVTVDVPIPTQAVSNVRLYCPEPLVQILVQEGTANPPTTVTNQIMRLEFLGECIDIDYTPNTEDPTLTDFVLAVGYYLVIKCEQVVQLQVLSRGYCPPPEYITPVDPCEDFAQRPIPPFFPADPPEE
ncbi:MAG TPA: hypothetical protein GX514_03220 [Thermoanaerobacterales bacterium]|nr:hypothetical protein [Thermoanaerobacterales bacterium]